ncbi:phenylalanine--tRNA ligase subunit beta [Candidatus Synechococcus calcipolaris G9]|uniref:Phenylalanine--tRNA ligase beta subunit n=1 Tax=Candidatus Synechococcus calcipolaris G9 TaxID=1497997 RepID=A0ABT6EX91_9SYNE|nr:phenylalanine--tRNA ligase subunit beta [Candidatus Synechococcus calcipolaris]MDG2990373.1 phenylalanine--tRNA ligase subunit beta [Candidatus Synechococcus calcipolaris G9]
MRVSLNWLRELVAIDLEPEALGDRLTLAGFEVEEIEDRRTWAEGVVVGEILDCDRHPNAEKLQVCQVDVGQSEPSTIVCGAPNAAAGLYVPVACPGAILGKIDLKIRPTKLRGVLSQGMICSLAELGLAKESAGIHIFDNEENQRQVGEDVRPILGLDDVVLDLTSTANRADALSMVGIAREVAALTGGKLSIPSVIPPRIKKSARLKSIQIAVDSPQVCPAYLGTMIKDIKVEPSPLWLQRRLETAGIRPINNVVDITNYILLTWGQPLHAFDGDRLKALAGKDSLTIGVRPGRPQETLKTLDGQNRTLCPENLLITANDQPVALAGVMGGEATEVHDGTTTIFLEAALFGSAAVRRSARHQGLRSEASARYERGVNAAELEAACNDALALIQIFAGGTIQQQVIFDQRPNLERVIQLRLEQVHRLLGPIDRPGSDGEDGVGDMDDLEPEEVTQALTALGFGVKQETETKSIPDVSPIWQVTVPPYRHRDIEREVDLIEEVARLYGYDRFIETLPDQGELGYLPIEYTLLRQIRSVCRGAGLTELMHYSWVKPGQSQDTQITVVNPLVAEFSSLRMDLVTGLVQACRYNLEQGNPPLNGFEVGRVFIKDEDGLWESDRLGGIISGDPWQGKWLRPSQKQQPLSWFEAKGILESIFARLGLGVEYQPDCRDERFHPGRTASLWLQGERLGRFGQLHPQFRQDQDLPEAVYVFELDIEVLLDNLLQNQARQQFHSFSTYPSADRDLALFAPRSLAVTDLQRTMVKAAAGQGSLLASIELFDQYVGEGVPEGQRSLAFRLCYRASDRTLTDAEVNAQHQQIRDALQEKYGLTLRS